MLIAKDWSEYQLIDAGNGEKLEKWGDVTLQRPDSQIIWPRINENWSADAVYIRASDGGGNWNLKKKFPTRWTLSYKNLKFFVEPTGFKHTGLFPEQAVNWDFIVSKISQNSANRELKILNLFAYTGAASVACAKAGALVVHIDASKGMNDWAKENSKLNNVDNRIRFITDDVKKFVQREIRRGSLYDGIIMDPPVYGRGPKGELWEIEKEITALVTECYKLLSPKALFFIANCYTTSFSHTSLENLFKNVIKNKGKISSGEIGLPIQRANLVLPCGIYGRWEC